MIYFSNKEIIVYHKEQVKPVDNVILLEPNVQYTREEVLHYLRYNHSLGKSGLDKFQRTHFVRMIMIHYEACGGFNSAEHQWFYDILQHGLTNIVIMNFQDTPICINKAQHELVRELYSKSKKRGLGEEFMIHLNTILNCVEIGHYVNSGEIRAELMRMFPKNK